MVVMPAKRTSSMTLATMPASRFSVGDDDDRVVGPLDVQPLHLRAHFAQLDAPPVHPDVAVLADRDQQVAGVAIARPSCASGLKTVMPASLMNDVVMMKKISRFDREVEHRRKVDAGVFRLWRVSS